MKENLDFKPISEQAEIVSEAVFKAASTYPDIMAAQIDPKYMNGQDLSDHYGTDPEEGVNCLVVRGKDGQTAAVLAPVGYRADLNGAVRNTLGTKVSMAPLEEILQETGMEYGSITPVGLPDSWKILIDSRLMQREKVIIGGGKQISKLLVPVSVLKTLPNAGVIEGLANSA